jgi:hypothetical protein
MQPGRAFLNEVFRPRGLAHRDEINSLASGITGGGLTMPKRLWDMLKGTEDAVPGDYILALVAIIGLMIAVLAGILA